jgi:hypothetical protein
LTALPRKTVGVVVTLRAVVIPVTVTTPTIFGAAIIIF